MTPCSRSLLYYHYYRLPILASAPNAKKKNGPHKKKNAFFTSPLLPRLLLLLATAAAFWAYAVSGWAAQVTLAWDPVSPTPNGYRLFSRTAGASYNYSQPAWTGTAATCSVSNLTDATQYFFVVRAYQGSVESGDSNEVSYTTPAVNRAPVANAGANQTVTGGALVTLNGSASSDPDGNALTYSWTQTGGAGVALSSRTSSRPTFTAPAATSTVQTLTFSLTVTDTSGLSSTATCQVLVSAATQANRAPVASAGADQTVAGGALVTLNGSASSDPDGNALTFAWSQTGGASVALSSRTSSRPTFTAPASTSSIQTLTFSLTVTDTGGLSSSATSRVLVSASGGGSVVTNNPPAQPQITYPTAGATGVSLRPTLQASTFSDADPADRQTKSEWRILTQADRQPVMDVTRSNSNMTQLRVPRLVLNYNTGYICQVRYFDSRGAASLWSPEVSFTTQQRSSSSAAALQTNAYTNDTQLKTVMTGDGQLAITVDTAGDPNIFSLDDAQVDAPAADDLLPDHLDFPYGLLSYRLQVRQPGQQVTVALEFGQSVDPQSGWLNCGQNGEWSDCSGQVTPHTPTTVYRQITDGGPEDADGVANGVIVDQLAPQAVGVGTAGETPLQTDQNSSAPSSGGGGCFIRSLFK